MKKILGVAALALLLSACNNEPEVENNAVGDEDIVAPGEVGAPATDVATAPVDPAMSTDPNMTTDPMTTNADAALPAVDADVDVNTGTGTVPPTDAQNQDGAAPPTP